MKDYRTQQDRIVNYAAKLWGYVSELGTPDKLKRPAKLYSDNYDVINFVREYAFPNNKGKVAARTRQIDSFWYGQKHITLLELSERILQYIQNDEDSLNDITDLFQTALSDISAGDTCYYRPDPHIKNDAISYENAKANLGHPVHFMPRLWSIIGHKNGYYGMYRIDFGNIPEPSEPRYYFQTDNEDVQNSLTHMAKRLGQFWYNDKNTSLFDLSYRITAACADYKEDEDIILGLLGICYDIPDEDIKKIIREDAWETIVKDEMPEYFKDKERQRKEDKA